MIVAKLAVAGILVLIGIGLWRRAGTYVHTNAIAAWLVRFIAALFFLSAISQLLTGCASPRGVTPPPPVITQIAPVEAAPSACIPWPDARAHVGEDTCIMGRVTRVFTDPRSGVTFIDFSSDRTAYSGFSPKIRFGQELVGRCVQITGLVKLFKSSRQPEHPETQIDDRSQVSFC